ncbi:YpfB family protein [Bacillus sp. 165]|uniref:YpfB family protein n=1 Tax=Bacillus sp. 165 TaxID=1529117 RepID=UPI001ADA8DF1|nr:YpfB family protein [Bacillus sp. 165]
MQRAERIIIKLAVIQLVFLLLSQALLTQPEIAGYLSKVVYYEGVTKGYVTNVLETLK